IGRCLRPDGGKPAVILDHVGNYKRLGHHLLERSWSLDTGVSLAVTSESTQMLVSWLCQGCNFLAPTAVQVCPECGSLRPTTEKEIVTVDADLVSLDQPSPSEARIKDEKIIAERLVCWESEPLKKDDPIFVSFPVGYFAKRAPWRNNPDPTPEDCSATFWQLYAEQQMALVRTQEDWVTGHKELVPVSWITKDPHRKVLMLERDLLQERRDAFQMALDQAKNNAHTLEDLIKVAYNFERHNPIAWAKTVLRNRNRFRPLSQRYEAVA
ncbi:hypothetical protein EBT31_22630, partial [bacterium]|nr:hypothetical protein [bacterium]